MTADVSTGGPAELLSEGHVPVLRSLVGAFAAAAERARRNGRPVLVSVSAAAERQDWVAVFEAARARGEDAVFWHAPWQETALVGVGSAWSAAGQGPERFVQASLQWRALTADAVVVVDEALAEAGDDAVRNGPVGEATAGSADLGSLDAEDPAGGPAPGPLLLGGFAFDAGGAQGAWEAFGDGLLVLPRVLYGEVAGRTWVTVNAVVRCDDDAGQAATAAARALAAAASEGSSGEPGAGGPHGPGCPAESPAGSGAALLEEVPPKEQWLAAVARAAAAIGTGRLEKAVLARSVHLASRAGFDLGAALRYLETHYPACYVFAFTRQGQCFLGATPERIVRKVRGMVKAACLAGSAPRGATPREDERLGRWLLADAKNRAEHRIVLRAVVESLAPVCTDLAAGDTVLRRLANVQHLYTPVTGRAADGVDVLDLVARVHPTPAVAGHPREAALALIREQEGWDRGWYAGPVGWMDAAGDGEFAVALRSALVCGREAVLFAGCGIMGDSDPESEYQESTLKLRPMRAALGAMS